MKRSISLCVILIFSTHFLLGQKKIVVMGSSTAAGTGASPLANSWVSKLQSYYRQNQSDNLDTSVINIALGGQNTYNQLPNGLPAVANRPSPPDPDRNVNQALSLYPDVIIINLPSNDIASGFSPAEIMTNFRQMYTTIVNAGVKCYITTTQPRTQLDDVHRQMLRSLVDSITNTFGIYSINFWWDVASYDSYNNIRSDVNFGDGIHVNNIGHNYLFLRVRDKSVFSFNTPLPVKLTSFQAQSSNNTTLLNWRTEQEEPNTFYEVQRSADGYSFDNLYRTVAKYGVPASYYSWSDRNILAGKSFYRLKITESGRETYSNIISVFNKKIDLFISKLFSDRSTESLLADISIQKSQPVYISIINSTGAVISRQSHYLAAPFARISLPLAGIASGVYFLSIKTNDNKHTVKAFNK